MVSLGCPEKPDGRRADAGPSAGRGHGDHGGGRLGRCGDRQHLRIYRRGEKKEAIDNILEFAQLKKEGQIQKIIVTGCLAQRYQQELVSELPECDGVLGLGANGDIVEAVRSVMDGEKPVRFPPRECWSLDGPRMLTTPGFFSPICASATAAATAAPTALFR